MDASSNTRAHNAKGFTLVELIIVLAIGALVIAAVLIAVLGAQQSRRDTQRKDDLTALVAAIEQSRGNNSFAPPANSAAISVAIFNRQDPTRGARYVIKDSGDPALGEIQYRLQGECQLRSDSTYSTNPNSAAFSYAVNIALETGENYCLDSDNSDNVTPTIAGVGTVAGPGVIVGARTDWAESGSAIVGCTPNPSRCITTSGAMSTFWATTGFDYTTTNMTGGEYVISLGYGNASTLPPANYTYNVNIYANGNLVAANQQLPIASDGSVPGPFVTGISLPAGSSTIRVEWTNDSNPPDGTDANFMLKDLTIGH